MMYISSSMRLSLIQTVPLAHYPFIRRELQASMAPLQVIFFALMTSTLLTAEHSSSPIQSTTTTNLIDQLPQELLERIFDFYVPYIIDESFCDYLGPLRAPLLLSSLCRRWREIAISLPILWNRCNLRNIHPELVDLFLHRASSYPQLHFCSHTDDPAIYERLPTVIGSIDRFRVLRLSLVSEPQPEDLEDDDESEAGNVSPSTMGSWDDGDGALLPEISPEVTADQLHEFRFAVSGSNALSIREKIDWCLSLIKAAPNLRSLDISVPHLHAGLDVPWAGLQHISVHTTLGLTIGDVISILSAAPSAVTFHATLISCPRASLSAPPQTAIPNLNFPELRWIRLDGQFCLAPLRFFYDCIASAPKLDTLLIPSSSHSSWKHDDFIQLLNQLPCPIRTFMIEMRSISEWMLKKYLEHRNIESSLRALGLFMDEFPVPPLRDTFLGVMTFRGRRRFLPNLERLLLLDCLQATDGQLAEMIESRVGNSRVAEETNFRFKSLVVRTPTSLYPLDGPFRHTRDWSRLLALRQARSPLLEHLQWQVQNIQNGDVSVLKPDLDSNTIPIVCDTLSFVRDAT